MLNHEVAISVGVGSAAFPSGARNADKERFLKFVPHRFVRMAEATSAVMQTGSDRHSAVASLFAMSRFNSSR
jgi:hypothetical protein